MVMLLEDVGCRPQILHDALKNVIAEVRHVETMRVNRRPHRAKHAINHLSLSQSHLTRFRASSKRTLGTRSLPARARQTRPPLISVFGHLRHQRLHHGSPASRVAAMQGKPTAAAGLACMRASRIISLASTPSGLA